MQKKNKTEKSPREKFKYHRTKMLATPLDTLVRLQQTLVTILIEEDRFDDALQLMLEKLCQFLGCQIGIFFIHYEDPLEIQCISFWSSPTLKISKRYKNNIQSFLENESRIILNKTAEPKNIYILNPLIKTKDEFSNKARELDLRNNLLFPIILKSKIVGSISLLITDDNLSPYFEEMLLYSAPYFSSLLKRKSISSFEKEHHLSTSRAKNTLEKKLAHLAYHDELTGLANRSKLQEKLTQSIESARKMNIQLAVLFIDLDHFKQFNDTLGHLAGDQLLKLVAKRLKNSIRKNDLLARIGGDEFVLIIPDINNTPIIEKITKKIMAAFSKPFNLQKKAYFLEASVGISIYPYDGKDGQTLLKNADTALALAKEVGRNNYQFCTTAILEQKKEWIEIEHALRKSIKENEFSIYYQPIFHMSSNTFYGFEALLRWEFKDILLSPGIFMPIAEKRNLILPIGEWVLETICNLVHDWKKKFSPLKFRVAINISPKQLRKEMDFLSVVKRTLKSTQADPDFLTFEVMEDSLMHDIKSGAHLINKIKKLGIKIGIDDFGTGYSSLNYIKYLSADTLKIDKSFVDHIDSPRNRSIIKHIVAMARSLNLKTIAEGIETQEQYDFLKKLKVDMGQGYFLGKPMPINKAAIILRQAKKNILPNI